MPCAIVSVTNDLTTDQRVDRTCNTLAGMGYEVLLVGRRLRNSKTLAPRPYSMHRMRLLFDKGPLFYAEFNISLFFFLLTHRFDLVVSNDLDTLPGTFLANKLKHLFSFRRKTGIDHLHDCHEYFRGVPELVGRKRVSAAWKWFEDLIFPRLRAITAVNASIADIYMAEYGPRFPAGHPGITIVRNVPYQKTLDGAAEKSRLDVLPGQKIILYQGAVNVDRGLEEAILAMKHLKTDAVLVIAGIGDIFDKLVKLVEEEGLTAKVRFPGQVPFSDLHAITLTADIGLSVEKDVGLNYHFCLPNKFLDYIQANVPVLVSPFPEMKAIVDKYHIGEFLGSHEPEAMAAQIDAMLTDPGRLAGYRQNLKIAAAELCWENEEQALISCLSSQPPAGTP